MSQTFTMYCVECKKSHWIGQSTRRRGSCGFYSYTSHRDEHGNKHQDLFMMEHLGHPLVLHTDAIDEVAGVPCHEYETVEYPERMDPECLDPT